MGTAKVGIKNEKCKKIMSGTYFFLWEAVIIRCFRYIWNLNTGAVMPYLIEIR